MADRVYRVLMVLPPDFHAPVRQRIHRFPPLGPAIVAAAAAREDVWMRACDLEIDIFTSPLPVDHTPLDDEARVDAWLHGGADAVIDALADALVARLPPDLHEFHAVAFSVDRHTQIGPVAVMGRRLKQQLGAVMIAGGASSRALRERCNDGSAGIDIITGASGAPAIAAAFRTLKDLPRGRFDPPFDPDHENVPRPLGFHRPAYDWPFPDFSIYALDRYRRDPVAVEPSYARYDGRVGERLVLPFVFTDSCQFQCSFCQTNGRQRSMTPDDAVAALGTLVERHGATEFFFVDAQINEVAGEFARALVAARLDIRWSDSYRIRPSTPEDLEWMARSGCAALSIGVESASEAVLRRMQKGHRPEHASAVLEQCDALGLLLRVNLLPCFPGETREDHARSVEWVTRHARAIDDLAPSSFYLTTGSPVGRDPERFGIRIRGDRELDGEYRYRKKYDALAYDEIGGMTWEEREQTLRPFERELYDAWMRNRGDRGGVEPLPPTVMLGLRRAFDRKDDAYAALRDWTGITPAAVTAPEVSPPPRRAFGRPGIVWPTEVPEPVRRRFDTVIDDAAGELTRFLGARLCGCMILLRRGDYLVFRGEVSAQSSESVRVRIDSLMSCRLRDTAQRRLHGRLGPGATFSLEPGVLRGATWNEPLSDPADFVVVQFDATPT